ncbi:hypothetical protein EXIGLDRAFT_751933 [Exidia glandulosa HHB12029]|uniref:Clp1-like protein n=1 Tax=Exidia glandulosa HHB12029 TaxID=1314781 RepID=A0A165EYH5_EXIGL|nr:hypothetical protein EXIGLDRAFT_751933 [Exidia glandulosa HHB12029]
MLACSTNVAQPALAPIASCDKENATHIIEGTAHSPIPVEAADTNNKERKRRRVDDCQARRPKRTGVSWLDREKEESRRRREATSPAGADRVAISTPGAKVIFPRKLARPENKPVPKEALAAVDPTLADVPAASVQEKLLPLGTSLMTVLAKTRAAPTSGLPQDIDVIVPQSEADSRTQLPTHMLAVHAKQPKLHTSRSGQPQLKRKVTLFPVHDLVLVAHCANLPTLPPSGSQLLSEPQPQEQPAAAAGAADEASETAPAAPISLKLPVVPLCLPSPPTFPILQSYLYTKRADSLLARLLPHVPGTTPATSSEARPAITGDRVETMRNLVDSLSDRHAPSELLKFALTTHGLWSNVCVLGVHDDRLWRVLDLAWEVLMGAMDAATRKHPEHSIYGAALTPISTSPPTTPPRESPASTPTTPTSGSNDSMSLSDAASSQTSPSSVAASDRADFASDMDTTVSETPDNVFPATTDMQTDEAC